MDHRLAPVIVNYRYWNKIRNCGDAIMAYVIQDVLGATPVRVEGGEPHLLGAGSIFFLANENSFVWGSGLLRPEHGEKARFLDEKVSAVRGQRTLEALRELRPGLSASSLAVGDPGIFVEYLLEDPTFASLETKYELAIVPHHGSVDLPLFRDLGKFPGVTVVDMRDSSLRPLRQIQQAEAVVSQSLHGLIFASALKKPNVWVAHRTDDDWMFKFADWFSTVENPQAEPLPLETEPKDLLAAAELRPSTIDRKALLDAFPRAAMGVAAPERGPILDFRSSRSMPIALLRAPWMGSPSADGEIVEAGPIVDSPDARSMMIRVRRTVEEFFANWSETPYVCLAPDGLAIPDRILSRIPRYMDRKPSVDALVVVPKAAVSRSSLQMPERISRAGGLEVTNSLAFLGGALVLRPGASLNFKRRIWNAFY
jgi:hypothetical protein